MGGAHTTTLTPRLRYPEANPRVPIYFMMSWAIWVQLTSSIAPYTSSR
ncbi:MAG: hypothetical protein JWO38_6397 [Gemmataceae bacterium]|nr:hypothetical protein [Gemmataceae bacterium]